jgi:CDP-glucose 4,6-dehydratase
MITGARGFQASHLAHRLIGLDAEVIGIVRQTGPPRFPFQEWPEALRFEVGSVEDFALAQRVVQKHSPTLLMHLAAWTEVGKSAEYPYPTLLANAFGTLNVLEAARSAKDLRGVVVVTSDKAYGPGPIPYRETQPFVTNPADTYSCSKAVADLLAQHYARQFDLPVRVVRPVNVFGPGQSNKTTLITATAHRVLSGQPAAIREGRADVKREYVYVGDAVEAYLRLAEDVALHGHAGLPPLDEPGAVAFNLGSGEVLTTRQVVEQILAAVGRAGEPMEVQPPLPGPETGDQCVDSSKFRRRFPDWRPRSFEEGLRRTLAWYAERLGVVKPDSERLRLVA